MSTYKYAAYGSNLHPVRLQERVPSAKLLGTSTLRGCDLRFNKFSQTDESGKCNVVAGDGEVHLAIFEISESERSILDQIEGLGYGYDHELLNAKGFGICSMYAANANSVDVGLRPFDWYRTLVALGCAFNEFPASYAESIGRVPAVEDPDSERSSRMWALVDKLCHGN